MQIDILFQDEDLLAVNKPPGVPSQPTPDPKRPSLISFLEKQLPGKKIFLHHRLDRDTSGVILFGLSSRANKPLTDIFREHQITKTYQALVKPRPDHPCPKNWVIQNHLAPVRDSKQKLMRMVVVKKGGWFAETHFRLISSSQHFDHIEAKPLTGRTHQIRVHTACEKRPILGDSLYGGKSSLVPRLMLHAQSLELKHPISGEALKIEAPLPKDFASILNRQ
ncbi:MAG: hypothetical protein BroJett040_01590 [Oligoflexia bacterium]|nr:MAG: hypothetical protein BroJett040_01590 [Oligoflexia bacterium]